MGEVVSSKVKKGESPQLRVMKDPSGDVWVGLTVTALVVSTVLALKAAGVLPENITDVGSQDESSEAAE